jgi:hypothetical protein
MATRKSYVYDKAQGKVVEKKDRWIEAPPSAYIIGDDMPMTKSPIDGKTYYTSKRALRAHYRQHGFEEIGTSYENEEYIEREEARYAEEQEQKASLRTRQLLIDRVIHGKR